MRRLALRTLAVASLIGAQACTSYVPALGRLAPDDRIRLSSRSPFLVVLANRDRVPTGRCRATAVTGRVLDMRGDTLVVGATPYVVPAPGEACQAAETATFVAPAREDADVEIRQPDARKTIFALGIAALLVVSIDVLLEMAFPYT